MTRRTPLQEWKLNALAGREDLRALQQEVPCDNCDAPAGSPCVNRYGEPLRKVDHSSRINKAERARKEAGR